MINSAAANAHPASNSSNGAEMRDRQADSFSRRNDRASDNFMARVNAQSGGFDRSGNGSPEAFRGFKPLFSALSSLLPQLAQQLESTPVSQTSRGDGPGPQPGEILGGTNEPGDFIDPTAADFTRDGGNVPVAELQVRELGRTDDGKVRVEVQLDNRSPDGGVYLTPAFIGVSDGSFDLFNAGESASAGLESLAEDGSSAILAEEFAEATGGRGVSGVLMAEGGGPLEPGAGGSIVLELDPTQDRFLNFAQMILPSNDAFLASGDNPQAIELFDENGQFVANQPFTYNGNDVLDAGTEVNTEQDAAFLNQTAPNTGVDENGTVGDFDGFIGSVGQTERAVSETADKLRSLAQLLSSITARY